MFGSIAEIPVKSITRPTIKSLGPVNHAVAGPPVVGIIAVRISRCVLRIMKSCSRKEYLVAINLTGSRCAGHGMNGIPRPCAALYELLHLAPGRHTASVTPCHGSSIILRVKLTLAICKAVPAILRVNNILGVTRIAVIGPLMPYNYPTNTPA